MMMAAIIIGVCACLIIFMARFYSTLPRAKLRASRPPKGAISSCTLAIFLGSGMYQRLSTGFWTKRCSLHEGGHTSEALSLVSALDFERYTPRKYIISDGDTLSTQKAIALELYKAPHTVCRDFGYRVYSIDYRYQASDVAKRFTIIKIPRARNVHQSILATPPSALFSLLMSIYHLNLAPFISNGGRNSFADVLILNGPGTCVVLCITVYINKVGGMLTGIMKKSYSLFQFLGLHAPKIIYVESFARVKKLSLSGIMLRPLVDR